MNAQHVLKLEAENIKRLKAVSIKPDGSSVVIVGGANGAGKSSTLDAIEWAFGGKPSAPKPIREGQLRARVVCETEDYCVTRTFSANGSQLKVEGTNGAKFGSPQALLDKLVGDLAFDPLEFTRMKPAEQSATLSKLVGLDLKPFDEDRKRAYDERTEANRQAKALRARLDAIPIPDVIPGVTQSRAEVMAELEAQQAIMDDNASKRAGLASLCTSVGRRKCEVDRIQKEIDRLNKDLGNLQKVLKMEDARLVEAEKEVQSLVDPDLSAYTVKLDVIDKVDAINRMLANRQAIADEMGEHEAIAIGLTDDIAAIDKRLADTLASLKFPVDGLAFSENGDVLYNGVPFEQASSAEQLKVSVAMGLAMNPGLRVLLIRDGSLLDASNLQAIADMAAEHDAQVWIVRVGDGKEVSVLIEDGQVVATSSC